MIKYALVCDEGHGFESWFSDSQGFETQARRGLVACPQCGSTRVGKALMAPSVSTSQRKARNAAAQAMAAAPAAPLPVAQAPVPQPEENRVALLDDRQRAMREAIRELHAKIAETTVDVGAKFTEEARRIHEGEAPARPIRGQASLAQAKELWEEGVPVLPIPTLPDERN